MPEGYVDFETETGDIVNGDWREDNVAGLVFKDTPAKRSGNKATKHAESIREVFAEHFWGPGQIPWQWKMI